MGVERLQRTIWWSDDEGGHPAVCLVDQTRLPLQGDILACGTYGGVCEAIRTLALRGAPAIGIGAAFAVAVWAVNESDDTDIAGFLANLDRVVEEIAAARPTAVNLAWAAHEMGSFAHDNADLSLDQLKRALVGHAQSICDADEASCRAIGANGAELFSSFDAADGEGGARILTHCNAGSLATGYYGTALGVVYAADERGYVSQVWVDETRPVDQGARLTTWELNQAGIANVLICDDMAASVMASGWVDAVIVGADRICANGDVVNKIGTYGLAVLAHAHGIPFYVAAPNSTLDPRTATGDDVVIEQRDPREVEGMVASGIIVPRDATEVAALDALTAGGTRQLDLKGIHEMALTRKGGGYEIDAWMRISPPGTYVYNPAFDVTPAALVTRIITENGVFAPRQVMESLNR